MEGSIVSGPFLLSLPGANYTVREYLLYSATTLAAKLLPGTTDCPENRHRLQGIKRKEKED